MLQYESIHNIDVAGASVVGKAISVDFAPFMAEFLQFARSNQSTKHYKIHDTNTQVVRCICDIVGIAMSCDEMNDGIKAQFSDFTHSIADKLLREEIKAQERIVSMQKYIKKGSLVQALLKDGEDADDAGDADMLYIVAKVEHTEWYDGESLTKSFGFPSEKKTVWKSAVIPLSVVDDQISIGSIRVYTDNEAKYWAKEFLELDEEKTNETNTRAVFDNVEKLLHRDIRKKSERDYLMLRNALIKRLRTPRIFNYTEFIQDLVGDHLPQKEGLDLEPVRKKLLQLPEKKGFDTQFIPEPAVVKERRRLKFPISNGVEIRIVGEVNDFSEDIRACEDTLMNRYLQVKCTDDKTFEIFRQCNPVYQE